MRLIWRTCDIEIQYRIFLDHVVDQTAGLGVHDQHFPLGACQMESSDVEWENGHRLARFGELYSV